MLRLHTGRRTSFPLYQLRSSSRAGVARLRRLFLSPDPGRIRPQPDPNPLQPSQRSVRRRSRSKEQARAEMEPRVASSSRDGFSGGSSLLLRALNRSNHRSGVSLHGRRVRGGCHGGPHVPRRSSPMARVASIQARLRLERVARRRLWEARLESTRHRVSLRTFPHWLLVRCYCHPPCPSGLVINPNKLFKTTFKLFQYYEIALNLLFVSIYPTRII